MDDRRLTVWTYQPGTLAAYDLTTGQLTTLTAPDGGTLAYTSDGALLTSEAWGGPAGAVTGRVAWTYDSDFRATSESVNGANAVSFGYDADSLLTQAGALTLTRDAQTGFVTGTTLGVVVKHRVERTAASAGKAQIRVPESRSSRPGSEESGSPADKEVFE